MVVLSWAALKRPRAVSAEGQGVSFTCPVEATFRAVEELPAAVEANMPDAFSVFLHALTTIRGEIS
jgi:hypothetical protein